MMQKIFYVRFTIFFHQMEKERYLTMKNNKSEIIYRYIRKKTKSILDKEDLILLLVDVRKIHTIKRFNNEKINIESGGVYQNEFTEQNQPDYLKDLPFGRYAIEISEEEFEYLSHLAKNDVESFITYIKKSAR